MVSIDYEQGLKKLRDIVQRQKPDALVEFGVLETRLLESLQREQLFGQSTNNDAGRSEALYRLIQFANEHFGIVFVDLCRPDETPTLPDSPVIAKKSIMEIDGTQQKQLCEALLDAFPANQKAEIWTGGSETFIKGAKYIIHEPVETEESSDKSAVFQQARALQVGTGRMTWLRQVLLCRATGIAATWKTALEKEGRLIIALEPQLQKFPNYLDSESTPDAVTLVYGAVQGETWSQYFGLSGERLNGRLTSTLLRSAVSLCDILKPLHARQSAHRSLTPDRIFITGGRTALLQDLGLATWPPVLGEGPKLYRGPEQINKGLLGPSTDVYQLGMILYHFITGTVPTSAQQVLPLRTWNSDLSVEQDAVLQRAIAFNVNERWRNAADFSSALKSTIRM